MRLIRHGEVGIDKRPRPDAVYFLGFIAALYVSWRCEPIIKKFKATQRNNESKARRERNGYGEGKPKLGRLEANLTCDLLPHWV